VIKKIHDVAILPHVQTKIYKWWHPGRQPRLRVRLFLVVHAIVTEALQVLLDASMPSIVLVFEPLPHTRRIHDMRRVPP
jgi:hypothetical protein